MDHDILNEVFQEHTNIVTVEDGCLQGGFGSAILEFMADNKYSSNVVRLGIPDRIVEHGEQLELHQECGFDPESIFQTVVKVLECKPIRNELQH